MRSPVDDVDPFIGTEVADLPPPSGIAASWTCPKPPIGNTHPGATSPFGMVSVCPFSGGYPTGYGRYRPSFDRAPERMEGDGAISGFTHLHQSGTGRIGAYYNLLRVAPGDGRSREHAVDEQASPGWYACTLVGSGVRCELTVAPRAAFHRYRFPDGPAGLTVDLSAIGLAHEETDGAIRMAELELTGPTSARGVVAAGGPQVHVALHWLGGGPAHLWRGDGRPIWGPALRLAPGDPALADPFGLRLDPSDDATLELRIGFSLRSAEQAEANLGTDLHRSFEELRQRARGRWAEHLGRVELLDASDEDRTVFYTALYHSLLKPSDFTHENPIADDDGPLFLDISTMWDLYRTQLPLVFALCPERGSAITNALIGAAEREGEFPISYLLDNRPERFSRQATALGHVTVADAHVHGLTDIDWRRALDTMVRTLDVGRGRAFARYGLVHPLSHTLDLAYAHHCTARLADALGERRTRDRSAALSACWRNAFDPATGLLGDSEYYEGDRWNYSFRLLHDQAARIALAGGEERFVSLLDRFFGFASTGPDDPVVRFEGLNNEPDLDTPYAYLWAGRHDRTAEVVRAVVSQRFGTGRGGLPGNDDSGGLSSWLVWNVLGLFPVAGQDLVLVGSPSPGRALVHLAGGDLEVHAAGDGAHVAGARLDGQVLDRPWLRWSDLAGDRRLELDLSERPAGWGARHRPPSCPPSALGSAA